MLFLLFVVLLFLDLSTKVLARKYRPQTNKRKKSIFSLEYLENQGAFLGILSQKYTLFFAMTLFVTVVLLISIIVTYSISIKIACIVLLAGAWGNAWNRISRGYVIDFIGINFFNRKRIIFNLADFYIIFSVLFLLIREF